MRKKIALVMCIGIMSLAASGQDIAGTWNGVLKVQGMQLRLTFNINKAGTGFTSTMDSPDQGAKGILTTSTRFEDGKLTIAIAIAHAGIEYTGTLDRDSIVNGTFRQAGQSFPLNLSRATAEDKEKAAAGRPQEPKKPYPYYEEPVSFENKEASVTLSGTLTLPGKEGVFPAVILISGSGPQNRDGELMGHKPFLVISDYLTRNGVAVLRFDERGVGASTGNFNTATSRDFSQDVKAGVEFLKTRKEINPKRIGLIGHSEGGLVAPMVAAVSKDIAFLVLLAGPGVSGDKILLAQQKLIGSAAGADQAMLEKNSEINKGAYDLIRNTSDAQQLKTALTAYLKKQQVPDNAMATVLGQLTNPWMVYFIQYDPRVALEKVRCPVLALNGERDLQVPPKENLEAIKTALLKGGNKKVTLKELPGLNHLFQEAETGLPDEYSRIEQTFSPTALQEIARWIHEQVK